MNKFKIQIMLISGFSMFVLFPVTGFSDYDRVYRTHANHNDMGKTYDLKKWKSGSNFMLQNNMKYASVATENYDTRRFSLTEPQRKSVNPWAIKKPADNDFPGINGVRPWGVVPDKFSKKIIKNNKESIVNNNVHANKKPKYQVFSNDNLLLNPNRNPSLLPIVGRFPTYTNSAGFSPMYANPGYGYGIPYFRPDMRYLSPYRW